MQRSAIAVVGFLFFSAIVALSAVTAKKKVAFINQKTCIKCGVCFKNCPVKAISTTEKNGKIVQYLIDPKKCIACGVCIKGCPVKAISWAEYDSASGISTPINDTAKAAAIKKDSAAILKKAAPAPQ